MHVVILQNKAAGPRGSWIDFCTFAGSADHSNARLCLGIDRRRRRQTQLSDYGLECQAIRSAPACRVLTHQPSPTLAVHETMCGDAASDACLAWCGGRHTSELLPPNRNGRAVRSWHSAAIWSIRPTVHPLRRLPIARFHPRHQTIAGQKALRTHVAALTLRPPDAASLDGPRPTAQCELAAAVPSALTVCLLWLGAESCDRRQRVSSTSARAFCKIHPGFNACSGKGTQAASGCHPLQLCMSVQVNDDTGIRSLVSPVC